MCPAVFFGAKNISSKLITLSRPVLLLLGSLVSTACHNARGIADQESLSRAPVPDAPVTRSVTPPFLAVEHCYNAWDDNQNGLIDEGCAVAQAQVQVLVAWDDEDADVDLLVYDPNGEVATADAPTASGLVLDHDCPADDECTEQPYELVYVESEEYLAGKYQIRVMARSMSSRSTSLLTHLGVRTPQGSRAYEIEFFDQGQSAVLDFFVAESGQSE